MNFAWPSTVNLPCSGEEGVKIQRCNRPLEPRAKVAVSKGNKRCVFIAWLMPAPDRSLLPLINSAQGERPVLLLTSVQLNPFLLYMIFLGVYLPSQLHLFWAVLWVSTLFRIIFFSHEADVIKGFLIHKYPFDFCSLELLIFTSWQMPIKLLYKPTQKL